MVTLDPAAERVRPRRDESPARRLESVALLVGAGFAALALRLWYRVGDLAVSVPYWDQWDFLDGLFRGTGLWDLFRWQHGPHRQGVAGIVYAALYPLTDWSGRAEAFVAWSAIVSGALLCLLLKRRLVGRLDASDLIIAFAFFSVSSFELFLGAQNLAHGPLPVLLVCGAALVARSVASPWRLALLVLLGIVATFTGFGLALGPVLAVSLGIELLRGGSEKRRRIALLAALAALAVGAALFLADYLWLPLPASECGEQPRRLIPGQLAFAGALVGRAWGVFSLRETEWIDLRVVLGLALLLLLASSAVRAAIGLARDDESSCSRWRPILLLSGFSLVFVALSSAGRSCLGIESALSSRYTLYSAPGMIGVYLWLAGGGARLRRVVLPLLLLLVAAKELRSGLDLEFARGSSRVKLAWVDCYRTNRDIDRCDRESGTTIFPPSGRRHSRIEEKLAFLASRRLSLFSEAEELRARERRLSGPTRPGSLVRDRNRSQKLRSKRIKEIDGPKP